MRKRNTEPLFHIIKRNDFPWQRAWIVRGIAILLALVVCGVITAITTGLNPFAVYGTMIDGAFGSMRKVWITLQNTAILLIISLALTPAFRMRFWNVGGEGQILAGGLAAGALMILLGDKVPELVLIPLIFIAGMAAGALWGFIPALFKALWNTNETLSTLMMNYIAIQLMAFFTIVWENPKGSFTVGIINQDTESGWLPELFGNKYMFIILIAVMVAALMYVYLRHSQHGYELAVVGESTKTAKYIGISTKKVIIRTMLVSGALCGLAGLLLVSGVNHTITTTISNGQGFTGVMVSWLAHFNPLTMVFASLLLVFFDRGAGEISSQFSLNQSFADILTGIILFFIIGCEFFINYKVVFRKKEVA